MSISAISKIAKNPQVLQLQLKTAKLFRPAIKVAHRHGPEILTGVGIAGGVGTVILASKATLQLEAIVDTVKFDLEVARTALTNEEITDSEYHSRIIKIRAIGIGKIVKLYGPAATLGAASVGAILGAHGIMKKRNVALAAAYKAIETSFEQYRKRVIDEFGAEKDEDFRRGVSTKQVVDKKSGEKKTVATQDPNGISQYARFFDEGNPSWSKTPEFNLMFLRTKQNYYNDLLRARGHVFLNEVYNDLNLDHSQAGAVVGWILNKEGDNYIDFGIYDVQNQKAREFVNGQERAILLDFNVDGVIQHLI